MVKYKQGILVVCMKDREGQEVAKLLADSLCMLYASCKELVDYEVFDTKAVIDKCGMEYFEEKEKKAIKNVSKYENCVIFVDYEYFFKGYDYFKENSTVLYLKIRKKDLSKEFDVVNLLAFEERDAELEKKADLKVDFKHNSKKTVDKILNIFRREE